MEQKKQICTSDELVTLSSDYPWLVAHDLDPEEDDTGDQIFYTLHDPMSHYRCQIPELVGRRIRGCFHGWMILSKGNPQYIEWSLWNPLVSKLIRLPRMILKDEFKDDEDDFHRCCLSAPPDDPGSILLLFRSTQPNIVFFNCKRRKRLRRWTEETYSKQMMNISGGRDGLLLEPTCCNGNIYAWSWASMSTLFIQIKIDVDKEDRLVIKLVPLGNLPRGDWEVNRIENYFFLKGSCTQLFVITLCVDEGKPCDLHLFKLDMSSMVWERIEELKDTVFFVRMADEEDLLYSIPPIVSELGGGYVHLFEATGDVIYSYNIKDETIAMSSMRCLNLPLRKSISVWTIPEFRLPGKLNYHNDQMVTSTTATDTNDHSDDDDDDDGTRNEACLLNIPFDVLEIIMTFCVGIEYLNFRATCRLCRLAAPTIQWSNENERKRLQTYSLVSPWLVVLDKYRGIITFTDPVCCENNYVIKGSPELFYYPRILCSRHGWLLLFIADLRIAFFNPFTNEIRKLPPISFFDSFSFSAPPTSPDCMVVAFSGKCRTNVFFHRVGGEPSWHGVSL